MIQVYHKNVLITVGRQHHPLKKLNLQPWPRKIKKAPGHGKLPAEVHKNDFTVVFLSPSLQSVLKIAAFPLHGEGGQ